jgi:hypothetical protein
MTDIHSCSYSCDRPKCIKAQRDELRDKLAQPKPLTDAHNQFNAAIDFAINQGTEAGEFLRAWREGDTSEWPEFEAAHSIQGAA